MFCDDRAVTMPPWTVFQSRVEPDRLNDTAEVVFNPIIMAPPNDYNSQENKRADERSWARDMPYYIRYGPANKSLGNRVVKASRTKASSANGGRRAFSYVCFC